MTAGENSIVSLVSELLLIWHHDEVTGVLSSLAIKPLTPINSISCMSVESESEYNVSAHDSSSAARHQGRDDGELILLRSADGVDNIFIPTFTWKDISSSVTSEVMWTLISALENFIRPIGDTRNTVFLREAINQETRNFNDSSLDSEAHALLVALEHFIKKTLNTQAQAAHRDQEEPPVSESPVTQIPPSGPALPPKLTDALRAHVSNNVPVRLISFEPDGSGMQLCERNAIFDHIAQKMRTAVDPGNLDAMIEKEFVSHNLQGQPLHQSLEEAERAVIATLIEEHSRYVILSHTWIQDTPGEVTYSDWHIRNNDVGYQKLAKFCKVAAQNHKVSLAWMDTICIDKNSSSELDESIRSMYKWYNNAYICVTYLADTTMIADMRMDRWFTRGWTLQELLAPRQIKFYDKNWSPLTSRENDKHSRSIRTEIKAITTITSSELSRFHRNVHDVEISRKMQWAASREVTREEDTAYSLLGIFGVSISIAYGEGLQRAFFRLVEAILASSQEVWDVFNCAGPPAAMRIHHSALIPSSPKDYLRRSAAFDGSRGHNPIPSTTLMEPVILTHLGVRMRVLFLLAQEASATERYVPYSRFSGMVTINVLKDFAYIEQIYNPFSQTAFYGRIPDSREIPAFCVLNFSETTDAVYIPSDCLAIGFQWSFDDNDKLTSTGNRRRMITKEPIVLNLHDTSTNQQFQISKKDLAKEGLQLFTLHL